MKELQSESSEVVNLTDTCQAIEYPLGDEDINVAIIKLNGRYPKEGRTVNKVCKEMAYVAGGRGVLVVEGERVDLTQGTVVLIEPGERFFWIGENLEMFMPCTPAWYPEQHKEVD